MLRVSTFGPWESLRKRLVVVMLLVTYANVPGSNSPWRLNFLESQLIFVYPKYATSLMSPFKAPQNLGGGGLSDFWKISEPLTYAILSWVDW